MLIAHGIDNFQAGCYQAFNGQRKDPGTVHLLQAAGISHEYASLMNDGLQIFGGTSGAAVARYGQAANNGMPSLATTRFAPRDGAGKLSPKLTNELSERFEDFLGNNPILNSSPKGSDLILRSRDGSKQIRFDLSNPHGLDPHINIETFKPRNLYPGDQRMTQVENIHVFQRKI